MLLGATAVAVPLGATVFRRESEKSENLLKIKKAKELVETTMVGWELEILRFLYQKYGAGSRRDTLFNAKGCAPLKEYCHF